MALTKRIIFNCKGGIVSPGYLLQILLLAADANIEHVRFGLRQQLLVDVPLTTLPAFAKACKQNGIVYEEKKGAQPNVVSSYPAVDIFATDTWLREGVYKDVFNSFTYTPKLKLNICDGMQHLIPFFTGHLNWVSSPAPHFWYLYIRQPKSDAIVCWRELIYTNDIAAVSQQIETLMAAGVTTETDLFAHLQTTLVYTAKAAKSKLMLSPFSLPYYEGFNKETNGWWLGIYRREELFALSFLQDVCRLCMQTKIGELYTTPWKSLIIKSIDGDHRSLWNNVLGKHRINVRHAANELNWQIEDEEGLLLKRLIIRHFDKEDVRTYGLCFAVQTKLNSSLFGSVLIRKEDIKNPNRLKSHNRYNIFYKQDFNPNTAEEILFRESVEKEYLGTYLVSLCKLFYEQNDETANMLIVSNDKPVEEALPNIVYRCKYCYTVYDETAGDEEQNVLAHTPFTALLSSYHCPTCEARKKDFVAVNENSLQMFF